MSPKIQRLLIFTSVFLIFSMSVYLVLVALKDNIVFFYSPTETLSKFKLPKNSKKIRIGGLVVEDSLTQNNKITEFKITDKQTEIKIIFDGILPDLFREGQGVVVEGYFKNKVFEASEVLAKHDENYMPKEVSDILKENGNWKGD